MGQDCFHGQWSADGQQVHVASLARVIVPHRLVFIMHNFDVFNGDADGLCALHQLRLAQPRTAHLVTGVKRDVALLSRVNAHAGDHVTVLDVSLDANRDDLLRLLELGAHVEYFDHHFASSVPQHPLFRGVIDTHADVCTSILVDRHLQGRYRLWAIVAAFGDNLDASAKRLATGLLLNPHQLDRLSHLGQCLNYNSYGDHEDDLCIRPGELYRRMHDCEDPLIFADREPALAEIAAAQVDDLKKACAIKPYWSGHHAQVVILPDAAWSRRVRGVLANALAKQAPWRAHAVLTHNDLNGYVASIRAPMDKPEGADQLCRQFATGSGRRAAAGINHLPQTELAHLVGALDAAYGVPGA